MNLQEIIRQPFYIHLAEPDETADGFFQTLVTLGVKQDKALKHVPIQQCLNLLRKKNDVIATEKLICRYAEAVESLDNANYVRDIGFFEGVSRITHHQAYVLLKASEDLRERGVTLLVPKKWQGQAPSKPKLKIELKSPTPSHVGISSLLNFNRRVTLNGRPLSEKDLKDLLEAKDGLAKIQGQWVMVDHDKFKSLMDNWDYLESLSFDQGIPFGLALRIVSGWQKTVAGREVSDEDCEFDVDKLLHDFLERQPEKRTNEIEEYQKSSGVRLREYQKVGVEWLCQKIESGIGGLLCDDMGLGKTIQVLAALTILKAKGNLGSILVVAPASLLENWRREAEHFFDGASPQVIRGGALQCELSDFVVTSYSTLRLREDLRSKKWDLVILDEAQKIKNAASQTYQLFKSLESRCRIAMTGTPVENHLRELWSIVDYVLPGLLGSQGEFLAQLQLKELSQLTKILHHLLSPFVLRRTKQNPEIHKELPDKIEKTHYVSLTAKQKALYVDCIEEMKAALQNESKDKFQILPYLMKFKKICNHPSHFLGLLDYDREESGKFLELLDLVKDIKSLKEKFLIFTQFRSLCGPIHDLLTSELGLSGKIITGDVLAAKRQGIVDEFASNDDLEFLVLSLHATGVGLNITAANHVIHFDRWWNPAVENQATDRAHRLGQTRKVTVHKLITAGTIEDKIDAIIRDKVALSDDFFSGLQPTGLFDMSLDELKDWMSLKEDF